MARNDWDNTVEINDFSRKNDKGSKRRAKEDKHWDKPAKRPKRQPLHSTKERTRDKEMINRYMSGDISADDFDYDYDER